MAKRDRGAQRRSRSTAPARRKPPAAAGKAGRKRPAKRRLGEEGGDPRRNARKSTAARGDQPQAAKRPPKRAGRTPRTRKVPRLDRARRHLEETIVQTPPSSLDMDRHGSAARTGRAEIGENRASSTAA